MKTRTVRGMIVGGLFTYGSAAALGVIYNFYPIEALMPPALPDAATVGGPLAVGLVSAAVYWKRDLKRERRERGMCVGCGYDLTGNISGVCPECGSKIESSTTPK